MKTGYERQVGMVAGGKAFVKTFEEEDVAEDWTPRSKKAGPTCIVLLKKPGALSEGPWQGGTF